MNVYYLVYQIPTENKKKKYMFSTIACYIQNTIFTFRDYQKQHNSLDV